MSAPENESNPDPAWTVSPPSPAPPPSPSSPPTPTFDSSPAHPDHVSQGLYPDHDEISHLASSLLNHTREREEEFSYLFGRLLGTVELSKRKLADMKVAVKAKRDDLIMMDNLIKLKEREVEDLQIEVNSVRSGKGKQSPASVTEINSPCKPTSLSQTASQPEMASAQSAPRTLDERRTIELMVTSNRLEGLEQELEANKDALKKLKEQLAGETEKTKSAEEKLSAEVSKNSKLKSQLIDAKDEVKMSKVATRV